MAEPILKQEVALTPEMLAVLANIMWHLYTLKQKTWCTKKG